MTAYLAWIKTQRGKPEAQVWRDLDTAQQHYAPSPPRGVMHDLFIAKLLIKPGDWGLSVDELAERYPCPS